MLEYLLINKFAKNFDIDYSKFMQFKYLQKIRENFEKFYN